MQTPGAFLDPNVLVLTVLASVFTFFLFSDDSEKWYWRLYFWSVAGVNMLFGLFGPFGYLFGVSGVLIGLWVYFISFQKRQFTMRDMLLYVLLLGCMCTEVASSYTAHPEDQYYEHSGLRKK